MTYKTKAAAKGQLTRYLKGHGKNETHLKWEVFGCKVTGFDFRINHTVKGILTEC